MRRIALSALLVVGACRPDMTTIEPLETHVRFFNAMVHMNAAATVSLDMMLDGAAVPTGATGVGTGQATPLLETMEGVHAFTAKLAGTSSDNIFSYVPKQYLTPGVTYTLVAAGAVDASGQIVSATPVFLLDDPFVPPTIDGVLMARFKFINAAPYATSSGAGTTVRVVATPGTVPPTSVAGLSNALSRSFMNRTVQYTNVAPGPYILTFAASNTILEQIAVNLAAGEVHTYVLYNDQPLQGSPGPANHAVVDLVDRS